MSELLYLKLYKKIEEEIASGRLLPYDRLPSKRALAAAEGVSPNTVITAMFPNMTACSSRNLFQTAASTAI